MSWVKLDDGFYDNAKVEAAGFDGAGLYAMCLSYCGKHLTDGFVPDRALKKMGEKPPTPRLIAKVTDSGLWKRVDGGYKIPDYTKENPTKKQTLEKRARDADRKRALADLGSGRNPRGFQAEGAVDSEGTPGTPGTPVTPLTAGQRGLLRAVEPADFKNSDVDRIAQAVRLKPTENADECRAAIRREAQGLSEGAVAKVRESCEYRRGRIGMGYAINALKSERAEKMTIRTAEGTDGG